MVSEDFESVRNFPGENAELRGELKPDLVGPSAFSK